MGICFIKATLSYQQKTNIICASIYTAILTVFCIDYSYPSSG